MSSEIATVATFWSLEEAHLAKNALEAAGIWAILGDSTMVGNLWVHANAIGGVKLQVRQSDVDRARAALAEAHGSTAGGSELHAVWDCPKCREKNTGEFEICWACGTSRDGREDPDFERAASEAREDEPIDDEMP